jgi:hypothetical protein
LLWPHLRADDGGEAANAVDFTLVLAHSREASAGNFQRQGAFHEFHDGLDD